MSRPPGNDVSARSAYHGGGGRMRFARAIPLLPISLLVALAAPAGAGTIVTSDGESITGDLKKTESGWDITQADGKVRSVALRDVKSIELGSGATKSGQAIAGLRSLQRSVEFSDDLPKIIQRYRAFIEQAKDPAVQAEAKADLTAWQLRLDQGLVKVGRRWVTPAERDELAKQWRTNAERARLLMKDARDREAAQLIAETLEQDPQNSSALYLQGVLAQKREDNPEAKKAFQAVQQTLPQHAPTLLNLSIILTRQKQWPAACVAMEQSLSAAPLTQVLLDSAAEFLNALPQDARKGAAAQRLLRVFLDQDARLQKTMAAKNLYRWGATWINQADNDRIRQNNDAIQKRLTEMQKEFDASQTRIQRIDAQVAENLRTMRDIEQHSFMLMPDGTTVRVPLPRAWYDLQTDNAKLNAERSEMEIKMEGLRVDAKATRGRLIAPTYSGVIVPINEDGVPLPVVPNESNAASNAPSTDAPATTEPTTTPSGPSTVIRIGPPDPPR